MQTQKLKCRLQRCDSRSPTSELDPANERKVREIASLETILFDATVFATVLKSGVLKRESRT